MSSAFRDDRTGEIHVLTDRFNQALSYAEQAHRTQQRKGTDIPYAAHLLSVCALVLEYGGNEDQAIAALLHDAVEDQGGEPRLEEIRVNFGEHVAEIVAACSDAFTQPKPPWQERKQHYINALANHDPDSWLVSCADKLHNARSILRDYESLGDELWSRFKGGKDGTLWYYRALTDQYRKLNLGAIAFDLDRVVRKLNKLARSAPLGRVVH